MRRSRRSIRSPNASRSAATLGCRSRSSLVMTSRCSVQRDLRVCTIYRYHTSKASKHLSKRKIHMVSDLLSVVVVLTSCPILTVPRLLDSSLVFVESHVIARSTLSPVMVLHASSPRHFSCHHISCTSHTQNHTYASFLPHSDNMSAEEEQYDESTTGAPGAPTPVSALEVRV
jgi:hypothetical protein